MKLNQPKLGTFIFPRGLRADLEQFAKEDGVQRGVFFDASGNARAEAVSATSQALWLFKTKAGKPFKWNAP